MNNISFYNSFAFKRYSYSGYRHTDNSGGITTHYVGQMLSGKVRFAHIWIHRHRKRNRF